MDKQPASRMCFVCGRQNPCGLKLDIYTDPDRREVCAEVVVSDNYQGYPGVVHGGVVAAMLDEVAGRAVLLDGGPDNLMVTLKLEVRYRRPTPTGTPLRVVGTITQFSPSRAKVHGEIRLPNGDVTAEADAVLMRPPASVQETWEAEKQYWRVYEASE